MCQMVQEEVLTNVGSQVFHEVRHGLHIDVVVTSNATHVGRIHGLVLFIVSYQLHPVKPLNTFRHLIQQDKVRRWVFGDLLLL